MSDNKSPSAPQGPGKPSVVVRDVADDLASDIEAVFAPFGGIGRLAGGRDVIIKPNGVHFLPGQATDTAFLEALIRHLRNEGVRNARGRLVVQINEDTVLSHAALEQHWAEHEAGGFDARLVVVERRSLSRSSLREASFSM